MSGHSHYATIKRDKAVKDAVRGKVFSKHAKAISLAIKAGGGANPEMNSKLRFAIEQAKADNTPKSNIDRILARAEEAGSYDEVNYEGYGPCGVAIIVQVATDNKNRTAQEIKNVFEKGGGSLGGPGSVSYNFEQKGYLEIKKDLGDIDNQLLKLIDLGVEEVNESDEVIEAYTPYENLSEVRDRVLESGMVLSAFEVVMKPKTLVGLDTVEKAKKVLGLLEAFEEHDDVQNVFSNLDIPPSVAALLNE